MTDDKETADESDDFAAADQNTDLWSQLNLEQLVKTIQTYVRGRYHTGSPHDSEEIATEVILRIFRATQSGRLTLVGDPTAYFIAVARNVVADRMRQTAKRREVPFSALESTDWEDSDHNAIGSFIEQDAAADVIRRALAAARADGDDTAYRVITFILDETERTGRLPSNRDVARRLGLSHTGVAKALNRFKRALPTGLDEQ